MKMFKSPERVFSFTMWLVSFVFAAFLMGLGGKIIADIPATTKNIHIEQFTPTGVLARNEQIALQLQQELQAIQSKSGPAELQDVSAQNNYLSAKEAYNNWLATRSVTANNPQAMAKDHELEKRTQDLDELSNEARRAQHKVEQLQLRKVAVQEKLRLNEAEKLSVLDSARPLYLDAVKGRELRIFGLRLLLTLPLLAAAGWMIRSKRKSQYWPLARGFVLFAGITFFFELVPYLPSYGGYVRYIVGILLCMLGGHYAIRAMQRYLARRKAEEQQNEQERRSNMDRDMALSKMDSGVCPGCDRKIPAGLDGQKVNHCVHCGLTLFLICPKSSCSTRNNAFYHYCPTCGTDKDSTPAMLPTDAPSTAMEAMPSQKPVDG